MPAAGFGMLMRLIIHYWMSDCAPLPTNGAELRAIARVHLPTWKQWGDTVSEIFTDLQPELVDYHAKRLRNKEQLKRLSARGAAALVAKRREKVNNEGQVSDLPVFAAPQRTAANKAADIVRQNAERDTFSPAA